VPDEEPDESPESEPDKTPDPEVVPPEGPDISKLSQKDQIILALRNQGHSILEISKRVKLSKSAVFDHLKRLQMRGFIDMSEPVEKQSDREEEPEKRPGRSRVMNAAAGRATAVAAEKAATWAAETIDIFASTGQWAWTKYKERAEQLGYNDILSWLGDCVEYWETERTGWQTVLDRLHLAEQRVEQLEAQVALLSDRRDERDEIRELAFTLNLAGKPWTGEQLAVLIAGRVLPARPVLAMPAPELG
jgi:transposase